MIRSTWVYDLETFPNCFLSVFYNINTFKWKIYEISDRKDEEDELKQFLMTENLQLIGFNNINFDYPILHNTILTNNDIKWTSINIYKEVVKIIESEYSYIYDSDIKIPQLDLYKIWHYDNKNKSTSLKWLEFAMRSEDVRDLPYEVGSNLTSEQMDELLSYCKHDVLETYKFFNKSLKHIELRQFYTQHEGIDLMNASEIKIAKEIFIKYLSKELKTYPSIIRKGRTFRKKVDIKDIIFDYIKFNDKINQKVLNKYNNSTWYMNQNKGISFQIPYKNVIREYAEGGLHSFGQPGIYESNDEYILIDVDFASYYPHLSFRNKLHPEHIPEKIFSKIYEGFYNDRKLYNKKDPRNYVLKIILNGSYGLSKDQYAFLYDPKWQLAICINGQLILTMLTERIFEKCKKNIQIIFENTDGAMYKIHRDDYELLKQACDEIEKEVKIPLEIQSCKKIIAKDVNNYINVISDDNIKFKGCFEIDRDYHKNHSKRIVPLALANYFINNIDINNTIINHLSNKEYYNLPKDLDGPYLNYGIFDFCIGAKMKGQNRLFKRYIRDFQIIDEPLSKMNRYYVSNQGYELIKKLPPLVKNYLTDTDKEPSNQLNIFNEIEDVKINPKDRETNIEAGWKCTLFNKYYDGKYDINYQYYIEECNKIINIFKQL